MEDKRLLVKQRVLFRAFFINLGLILVAWLLSMCAPFIGLIATIMGIPAAATYHLFINWIAIWDIAGAVLFLVPALAIWWERAMMNKK